MKILFKFMTYVFDKDVKIIDGFNHSSKSNIICIDLSRCENLEKINDYAFNKCCNLETIILPKNIKLNKLKIGDYAFIGCNNRIQFEFK